MANFRRRWLSNSAANLFGGGSAAAFNLILPAIVSRYLPAQHFSSWSLALQVVAYVNLLGLGLQTATARAIAGADGDQSQTSMHRIVRAGQSIANWSSLVSIVVVLVLCVAYPWVFPDIPAKLLFEFRAVIFVVGLSSAIQLLALVPMGLFQGLHTNINFVAIQVGVRIGALLLVGLGIRFSLTMVGLACLLAVGTAVLTPLIWYWARRMQPWLKLGRGQSFDPQLRKELLKYCATLSVWGVSMLLVNSVGIVMVGRIAFEMSGPYALAMSAATVLAGLLSAVFSPLLTTASALHANLETRKNLPRLLLRATQFSVLGLSFLFALVLWIYQPLIGIWVGHEFISAVGPMLLILVGAHALRNLMSPYALMLLATGSHNRALWTGLAEGLVNLGATVVLGLKWGVIGIALGTLAGAVAGILGCVFFNIRRTPDLTPSPVSFVMKGIFLPMVVSLLVYIPFLLK